MKIIGQTKRFGDIASILKGKNPALSSVKVNGSKVYLSAKYLRGMSDAEYVPASEKKAVSVYKNEIIIICDGSNSGESFYGFEGILSSTMGKVQHSGDADVKYILYFLHSATEHLRSKKTGTAIPHLDIKGLMSMELYFPPTAEQKRIASKLDEVLGKVAFAAENVQKNLENSRELFDSYLNNILQTVKNKSGETRLGDVCESVEYGTSAKSKKSGKVAVLRMGNIQNGRIDWNDLVYTDDKDEIKKYLLKQDDVLFNRTNSPELVGKTAIYKGEMPAIFAGYLIRVHRDENLLDADYLNYFLNSDYAKEQGKRVVVSSVHQANINGQKLKNYLIPLPSLQEQKKIVKKLDALSAETKKLEVIYQKKLAYLAELKNSVLNMAFSGELSTAIISSIQKEDLFPLQIEGIKTTDLHAGILAKAYSMHESAGKERYFGRVKGEKISHMIEAYVGIDLGRVPVKDPAGPDDYKHLLKVEHRASKTKWFDFKARGGGYYLEKGPNFNQIVKRIETALGEKKENVERLIAVMMPWDTEKCEVFATTFAAWNNLLLDGKHPYDSEIVYEARENWHEDKLKIKPDRFFNAIQWMRQNNMTPLGRGKRVRAKK